MLRDFPTLLGRESPHLNPLALRITFGHGPGRLRNNVDQLLASKLPVFGWKKLDIANPIGIQRGRILKATARVEDKDFNLGFIYPQVFPIGGSRG